MGPRRDLPVRMPTIADDGTVPIPRPAAATSASLPESYAATAADQVEDGHQSPGIFDGSFNEPVAHATSDSTFGPYTVESRHDTSALPSTTIIVPAYYHDSVEIDLTLVGGDRGVQGLLFAGPVGSSSLGYDYLPSVDLNTTADRQTITVALPATVAYTEPMQIRLDCVDGYAYSGSTGTGSCIYHELRFQRAATQWHRVDHWTRPKPFVHDQSAVLESFGALGPDTAMNGGPFLGIGDTAAGSTLNYINQIRSEAIRFPPFNQTDVLTFSLRYAQEVLPHADPNLDSSDVILIQMAALDNPAAGFQVGVIPDNPTAGVHGWQTYGAPNLLQSHRADMSGQTLYFVISSHEWANLRHRTAIDAIQFYLNGTPIPLPLDQICICGPTADVGKPINTLRGNQFVGMTDLAVASGGLPLQFDRLYTSFLTSTAAYTQTALGPGWRHGAAASLTLPSQVGGEAGRVIYEAANGQRYRFVDGGSGFYQAQPGVHATLALTGTTYVLTMPGQATQEFNAQGRLTAQVDEQGHRQTISYGTSGAAAGQPIRVTDLTTSRSLTLTYTTLGSPVNAVRLRAVADDLQRTVTFTHSATTGDLTAVSSLSGGETRYAYDSLHQLTAVWQPWNTEEAPDEENTYTNGRVTRQEWADGTVLTLAYATNPTTFEQTTTITTTGIGMTPSVETHHYRADNTLRYTTRNGRFLGYTTWNGAVAPNATVDGNGMIARTQTTSLGLPTRVTTALGQSTTVAYDRANHPRQVVGSNGITSTMTYGPSGTLTETLQVGDDGTQLRTGATYDATTKRLRTQTRPDGVVTWMDYDSMGQVTTQVVGYGTTAAMTTTYAYDVLGRVTDVTVGAGTALARTTHTTYRPDGQVATVTENYHAGQPATASQNVTTTSGYDNLGRRIWTRTPDGVYHGVTRYTATGQVLWTAENTVDGSGVPTVPDTDTPPTYSPARPGANVATLYGYDGFGRTVLVTQTGILTGTFLPSTQQFTATTTRTTRTEYDLLGRPVTTTLNYQPGLPMGTLPDVNVQTFTYYDGTGNVIWQSDAGGHWTRTEYDALNRPVTTTLNYENGDPGDVDEVNEDWTDGTDSDIISVTQYDAQGRVAATIQNYANGVWTTTEPITDVLTIPAYDGLSRPITTTTVVGPYAADRSSSTAYDAVTGRRLASQDAMGIWTVPQYDVLGRSVGSIQNCTTSGGVPQTSSCATYTPAYPDRNVPSGTPHFDALGRAFATEDALGTVTRTTYDGLGRTTSTIQNYVDGGPTTAITNVTRLTTYHDASGHTVSSTDPTGVVVTRTMVLLTQTTIVTDGAGLVSRSGGDGTGATRWSRGPDGAYTVTLVDGLGRPIQTIQNYEDGIVTTGDGADRDLITTTVYDRAGRRQATMDPLGRITRFGYNGRDQLTRVVENELDSTTCTSGRTDCNLVTTYRYDRAGNQIAVTDARNLVIRQAAYNAAGEPTLTTDALGQEREWDYNQRGQVIEQIIHAVPNHEIYTSYDALGRVTQRLPNGPVGEQRWTYDILGRPVTSYDEDMASYLTHSGIFTTTYDVLGRVQYVTQNAGHIDYDYDADGQLDTLNADLTETEYVYDSARRPSIVRFGINAAVMAVYSYDSAGRLHTTTNVDDSVTTTSYDGVGRITDLHTVANSSTTSRFQYAYDRAGQRTQLVETVNGTTRTLAYSYDGVGRLTAEAVVGGTTTGYTYDKAGNRLSVVVNSTPVQTVTYNAASQVTNSGWVYDDRSNLETDGTNSYVYDMFDRLSAVITPSGTSNFWYMGEVLQQIKATGQPTVTLTQDTTHGLSKLVYQQISGGGDRTFFHGGFGEYLGFYDYGYGHSALKDALGTVRATVQDGPAAMNTTQYSAWGEVQSGDTPDPYGFAGEYTDATSGLVYLRARWYNPKTGTLLGRDPFMGRSEQPATLHPYQYAWNAPTIHTDPSGRDPWWNDPQPGLPRCDGDVHIPYRPSPPLAPPFCNDHPGSSNTECNGGLPGLPQYGPLPEVICEYPGSNYTPDIGSATQYYHLIEDSARRFGVPWQIVAGLLESEIELDTGIKDYASDFVICIAPGIGQWATRERFPDGSPDPGPGVGNAHISTQRRVEEYFYTEYGVTLPVKNIPMPDAAAALLDDKTNILYVAATVRWLADYRFGSGGQPHQSSHANIREWTLADAIAIWHAYRFGVERLSPGGAGFTMVNYQDRNPDVNVLLNSLINPGGRGSASAAIPYFRRYFP